MKYNVRIIVFIILCFFMVMCKDGVPAKSMNKDINDNKSNVSKFDNSGLIWKYGVACKNGEAIYLDPTKLDRATLYLSPEYIKKLKIKNAKIAKASEISFEWQNGNYLYVYDSILFPEQDIDYDSKKKYSYKIENEYLFIYENGKKWDQVKIRIVKDFSPNFKKYGDEKVYMVIYFGCKWFEGEYEIIGPL